MKTTKLLALTLAVLFTAGALAGCTSRSGEAATPQEASATAEPTPEPTPEPVAFTEVARLSTAAPVTFADEGELKAYLKNTPASDEDAEPARCTLVREESVDSDCVIAEDEIIYVLADGELKILRLTEGNAEVLSSVTAAMAWKTETGEDGTSWTGGEKAPFAIREEDGMVAVLSDRFDYSSDGGTGFGYGDYTAVDIYDCTDPANPRLTASLGQSGTFALAELEDDVLILLTAQEVLPEALESEASVLPAAYDYGTPTAIPVSAVTGAAAMERAGFSVVGVYDLRAGTQDTRAVAGFTDEGSIVSGGVFFAQTRQGSIDSRTYTLDGVEYHENAVASVTDLYGMTVNAGGLSDVRLCTLPGGLAAEDALAETDSGWVALVLSDDYLEAQGSNGELVENAHEQALTLEYLDRELNLSGTQRLNDGPVSVLWAALGEDIVLYATDDGTFGAKADGVSEGKPILSDAVRQGICLEYGEDEYVLVSESDTGRRLSLLNAGLSVTGEISLGEDFSRVLTQWRGILSESEQGWIGLPANDSYCLYKITDGGITFLQDFFFNDWMWNVSARLEDGYLILTDTRELLVHKAVDLSAVSALTF